TITEGFNVLSYNRVHHLPNKGKLCLENEVDPPQSLEIDVYFAKNPEQKEIKIADYVFTQEQWDRTEEKDIFGIPIRVPGLIDILDMKLHIKTRDKLPRDKDIVD